MKLSADIKRLITIFFIWRTVLFFLSLVIVSIFDSPRPRNSVGEFDVLRLWANWDGGHYIGIALNGYGHIMQYAFFPLYPMLIKITHLIIPDPYISALLVSNAALLGTMILLYKVSLLYGLNNRAALYSVLLLLIFPSSFFLGAAFTESLFLFLCLLALYLAKTGRWFFSSIASGLACFTKFIAISILLVLILEYLSQRKVTFTNIWHRLNPSKIDEPIVYLAFFGPFGIYVYCLYLFWNTGYWFFFRDAQMHWGRSLSLVNPFTVLQEGIKQNLLDMRLGYLFFSVHALETVVIIFFLLLLPLIYRRFGLALTLYTLIISSFTLFSGKVDSSLRYVLTAFPAFMLFGDLADKEEYLYYFFLILFTPLLGMFLILFLTGNWIG